MTFGFGETYVDVMLAAYHLVNDHPGGASTLAPLLGKVPATLSHEVNPNYPTAKFGLQDAVTLSTFTRSTLILDAFASQMNAVVVPLPDAQSAGTTFAALSTMATEFADLVAKVTDAVADGRVSPNELAAVQREASHLVAAVHATLRAVQDIASVGAPHPARKAVAA